MTKRVLVVGCGFPQLSLLRRAKNLGLDVLGCDLNPQAVGVPECSAFERVSTGDADAVAALVVRSSARALATSGSEVALKTVAAVAARLGLPFYADPETVRRCQDKDAMRAAYSAAGLRIPGFVAASSLEEARAFAGREGFPLVVKPARGWGQRGVARVDSDVELARAFEEARAYSTSAGLAAAVVEACVEGREYSVNGWVEDGWLVSYCVTERLTVPGKRPLGVMIAELFPSGLGAEDEARLVDEARRGARALGLMRGPCYSQVAFGDRGPILFETAARLGGGFDADVTRLACGVDLYTRVLGVALGDPALEGAGVESAANAAAVAKFLVARPGMVRAITGLDDARALEGIACADVFVPVGGRVQPLSDSSKRAAFVLAHGASRDDVLLRADRALSTLHVATEEPSLSGPSPSPATPSPSPSSSTP